MSKKSTAKISRILTIAREENFIQWGWIVDETRAPEKVSGWRGLSDYGETMLHSYRRDFWEHQPYRVEVVSEKATVSGILRPVLDEFAVDCHYFHGFGSATSVYDLAQESLKTKQLMVLLYVGDYDPSGMHMSEVDLPGRIERYAGIINLNRIALIESDCNDDLPSFSAEEKCADPR